MDVRLQKKGDWQMKKERIVVLCLCAVLLGSIYAQWIAWACHLVMPSINLSAQPVPFGSVAPSETVMNFVSAGWPPVGFLYAEVRLLNGKPTGRQTMPDATQDITRRTFR